MHARFTITVLVLLCEMARADVRVDWARGLVIADVVGIADRHAPNPAVARGTSRRGAEDAAKKQLAGKLDDLPLGAGGTLGGKAKDKAVKERLERAVANAITLSADPETDGAWRVSLAVPIEAVRQAIAGPRSAADGDKGPAIMIVDGATAKPAVGWKIGTLEAAAIWVTEVPAWAKDAPHVKATGAKTGVIEVAGIDATPATLFVIITKP